MKKQKISLNPTVGCSRVSAGCRVCVKSKNSKRLKKLFLFKKNYEIACKYRDVERWNGKISFLPDRLKTISGKEKIILLGTMGDLFHENVSFDWLNKIMAFVAINPQHHFMVSTKRPERMFEYFCEYPSVGEDGNIIYSMINDFPYETYNCYNEAGLPELYNEQIGCSQLEANSVTSCPDIPNVVFPLKNLWLGVTCENQKTTNDRISILKTIPAEKRFVSFDVILEQINITSLLLRKKEITHSSNRKNKGLNIDNFIHFIKYKRKVNEQKWIDNLLSQCQNTNVPFLCL